MKYALPLLLVLACVPALPRPELKTQGPMLLVVRTEAALRYDDQRWARWERDEDTDLVGPIYYAVAANDQACILPAKLWTHVRNGQYLSCAWRAPRWSQGEHVTASGE